MEIPLDSELEEVLNEAANRLGVTPRILVLSVLRERFQGLRHCGSLRTIGSGVCGAWRKTAACLSPIRL